MFLIREEGNMYHCNSQTIKLQQKINMSSKARKMLLLEFGLRSEFNPAKAL